MASDTAAANNLPAFIWDEALIRRYDLSGPRYTSYPTAVEFTPNYSIEDMVKAAGRSKAAGGPISLYTHLPFCAHLCYYCACNRIITADRALAGTYLQNLKKEIHLLASHVDKRRQVTQLHWGGGTPTYLSDAQITELVYDLARHFNLREDDRGDYAIEVDPRTVDRARLGLLRGLGFNRLSLGVQDLNPLVQQAVNRVQSFEMIRDTLGWARDFGFKSINVDLISGLPWQTEMTMARTLEQLIYLKPERISVYGYAHLPDRFKIQRQIDEAALPSPTEKIRMYVRAGRMLQQAGYRFIGMDHFALESDEMAVAQRNGLLHRNFQGYTLHGDADLLGMGVSAISQIGNLYVQNHKVLGDWQAAVEQDRLPHHKGYQLDKADLIRRDIIMKLLCDLRLDIRAFEQQWAISFQDTFAEAMIQWRDFADQGLVVFNDDALLITEQGRLVSRALVQPFDSYLTNKQTKGFSRII